MELESKLITIHHWVIRFHQLNSKEPCPVFLLLHGWTGDENSMWIFTPRLPKNALLISPRGLYKTKGAGYSWHSELSKPWPTMDELLPAVDALMPVLSSRHFPGGDFSRLHVIGFSQGAALAYTLAAVQPECVATIAGLSGFLPEGASAWLAPNRLSGLAVFIAHGTEDDLVPVELARKGASALQVAGANVTYCEEKVGHKLSAKCFRGLEAFYRDVNC